MKNSTKELVEQIIELDSCPFTIHEVHGFFIGLSLSSIDIKSKHEKAIKFLDLTSNLMSSVDKIIDAINAEFSDNHLEIYSNNLNNSEDIATAVSEWTYYFLISYTNGTSDSDPAEQEILDIFDEISQVNQKYKLDDKQSSMESLNDINGFIIKSALYLFHRRAHG